MGCDVQPRIFLQDNFPVHLAPRIHSWFSKNEAFNIIRLSTNSLDLMPLCQLHEMLLAELNKQEIVFSINFWRDLNQCFESISTPHIVETLLLKIPITLKYIISNNGELRHMWNSRKIQNGNFHYSDKWNFIFIYLFNLQTIKSVCARLWQR